MAYVYIIAPVIERGSFVEAGPVKVGVSDDPWARLAQLQTGSPVTLDVIEIFGWDDRATAFAMERVFHAAHQAHRLKGEWFDVPVYHAYEYLTRMQMGFVS